MFKVYYLIIFLAIASVSDAICQSGGITLNPDPPRDGYYDKITYPNRRVVPYHYLTERDVMWNKRIWRIIDVKEKINQPIYYPSKPTNLRKNLIHILREAVITENRITPYDSEYDDFKIPLNIADIRQIGAGVDSIQATRPYPPYDMYDTVIVREFDPTTVKQYRLKEDWYFDRQRSVMEPRILGICPRMAVYSKSTFEFLGYSDMFWLYFPEVRKVLVNEEVYNPYNFGTRITFDDLFMKRMFSSLIYKVDNTFDRRVEEYEKGLQSLLEAENIKDQIFKFEHDVWEQ